MMILFYILLFFFVILCALLSLVILVQESKSMGLGAAFGGDSGDSLFGTSTADVLKKFTSYLIGIFMISCLILSLWTGNISRAKTPLPQQVIEETTTQ